MTALRIYALGILTGAVLVIVPTLAASAVGRALSEHASRWCWQRAGVR